MSGQSLLLLPVSQFSSGLEGLTTTCPTSVFFRSSERRAQPVEGRGAPGQPNPLVSADIAARRLSAALAADSGHPLADERSTLFARPAVGGPPQHCSSSVGM